MLGAIGRIYTVCVGVFIAERLIDSVVDVVRVIEGIMYVKMMIGKQILNIVSVYVPHMGLRAEEKVDLWAALSLCSLEFLSKLAFSLNGHVVIDTDGYGDLNCTYCFRFDRYVLRKLYEMPFFP